MMAHLHELPKTTMAKRTARKKRNVREVHEHVAHRATNPWVFAGVQANVLMR